MNTRRLKTLRIVGALMLAGLVFGQAAGADATANAKILAPITITTVTSLDFGAMFSAVGATDSTVSAASTAVRTGTATFPTSSAVTAAKFTVNGTTGANYTVTLPADAVPLTRTSGAETMSVTAFTKSSTDGTEVGSGAAQDIYVGASIAVGAGQVAGVYTGSFTVSVNYD
jgi:hypothetical protein